MRKSERPISEIINRIPRPDELRARLVRNLQERTLIRKLLRLAEQRGQTASQREVSRGR